VHEASGAISLQDSRQWCAAITRSRAANFYWGLRLAPEDRRPDLYATYAWMRIADDIADGDDGQDEGRDEIHDAATATPSSAERARSLDLFERATHAALDAPSPIAAEAVANAASEQRWPLLWPAFVHACRRHPIDRAWWDASLEGMREDLDHHAYASMADLERYCYRVGSTVGLVCVAIWGVRASADQHALGAAPKAQHDAAIARGVSFQLTNIIRDIAADASLSPPRCYIPEDVLRAHAITHADLLAWNRPRECESAIRVLIDRAQHLREQSMVLETLINPDCLPVLRAMSNIYWRLLDKLDADPSRAVSLPVVRVPTIEKLGCVLGALWHGEDGGDDRASITPPNALRTTSERAR
jgi:phytoene synthase